MLDVGTPVKVRSTVQGIYRPYVGMQGTIQEIDAGNIYPYLVRFSAEAVGVFSENEIRSINPKEES